MKALKSQHGADRGQWLRRLWGYLPLISLVLLVGMVAVMATWIISEGKAIEEKKKNAADKETAPVNVVALDVRPGPIRDQISLPGVVKPWVALKVVAEVGGKIVAKPVNEGRTVHKNDILAVIDKRDYENAFVSARASYRAAKASMDRLQSLFEDKLATQSQLDDAVAAMETTKAAMDNAALNLERCTIRSAMDGVVDRLPVEIGQYVTVGDPVADVLQIDRVKVEVGIPESDVDAVRRVKTFPITLDALDGKSFTGRYHYMAKSADSLARSYRLEVAVDNPKGEILPDMFARVRIVKNQVDDGLAVPLFSLISHNGSKAVYLADNGKARMVRVQTGMQEGWKVEVTSGLHPGDHVIVVGQKEVRNEAPVKVLRTVSDPKELDQ